MRDQIYLKHKSGPGLSHREDCRLECRSLEIMLWDTCTYHGCLVRRVGSFEFSIFGRLLADILTACCIADCRRKVFVFITP